MAFKPTDWLGPLIEEDTRAAVAWFQRKGSSTLVKKDPGCRFDHDASNILSEVESPLLSGNNSVQIVKVLSADELLLLVSDGFTSVRARLSVAAVATLEAEIGEPISSEVKGDVFAIERCTVISTPYGPPSEQVRLSIDGIKYLYHLRKVVNASTLAGERPEISRMMMQVIRIRHPEQDPSGPNACPNGSTKETQSSERFATQAVIESPKSQADVDLPSSPPAILSQKQSTQNPRVTPVRHRRAPDMARDGVEMTAGVNLARPTAAIPNRQAQHSTGPTPSGNKAHLLSVLGTKRKASDEGQTRDLPLENPAPAVNLPAARPHQSPVDAASPVASAGKSTNAENALEPRRSEPIDSMVPPSVQSPNRSESGRPSSKQSARARAIWQRDIPKDQHKLLDAATSWLPPLPGRQFPHPNVPIELLKQWNEQALKEPDSVTLSQSQPRPSADDPDGREHQGSTSSSSEETCGDDSDKEIPGWSSSPAAHMQPAAATVAHPPTSNHITGLSPSAIASSPLSSSPPQRFSGPGTPVGLWNDLPPDSSFEQPVAPRALPSKDKSHGESETYRGARPALLAERSRSTPRKSPETASERRVEQRHHATHSASPKGLFTSRSTQHASSSVDKQGAFTSSAFPALGQTPATRPKGATAASSQPRNAVAHTTPRPGQSAPKGEISKAVTATPDVEILHVRQSPAQSRPLVAGAPPSTAASVVKGTQMQAEGDDDVMEIEPPPRVDPLLKHKQRRSEHFRKEQRRKWIRANFTLESKRPFSLGALYSGYKKAYPRDELRPSQLAEALAEEFPHVAAAAADDNTPPTLPNGSAMTTEQVSPSAARAPASRADLDAPDPTPRKAARRPEEELEGASTAVMRSGQEAASIQAATMTSRYTPTSRPSSRRPAGGMAAPIQPSRQGTSGTDPPALAQPERPTTGEIAEASAVARKATARSTDPSPIGSALPASTKGKNDSDHRAWLIKRIGAEQQRLREGRGNLRERGDGEAFREFADAWRASRPGGAFAKKDGSGREREGRQRKRLRVLEWGL